MPFNVPSSLRLFCLSCLALCTLGSACFSATLPNNDLTPGAVRDLTKDEICSQRWSRHWATRYGDERPVLTTTKRKVAAAYAIPWSWHSRYQFDHLVPRCAGGADTLANMWPQPLAEAKQKDRLEKAACKAICTGKLDLTTTQHGFRQDWQALYRKVFGHD